MEIDLFLLGVMDLHRVGGHLHDRATVDEVHILFPDAEGGADAVDRHVAASDDDHFFSFGIGVPPLTDVQKIPDAGDEPPVAPLFALDPHGHAVMGAHADEDGVEVFSQVRNGDIPAHLDAVADLHAGLPDDIHLSPKNPLGAGGNQGYPRRPSPPVRGVSRRSSAGSP